MKRKKAKARLWAVVSDTGGEGRLRDASVALIRGTRRDADRYAAKLVDAFGEMSEVLGPMAAWTPKRAAAVLAADLKDLAADDLALAVNARAERGADQSRRL